MTINHSPTTRRAVSAADSTDIAALDRLAGQLAPQSTLRRYGRQHTVGRALSYRHGLQRLWSALRSN